MAKRGLKTKSLEGALDRNVQASPVAVRVDPVQVIHGDSREALKLMADASVDSVVCDPPYALVSITKRFANSPRSERTENTENPYGRTGRGFMGQRWDTGETAFDPAFWEEVLRVLKPGAHLIAFGGTRTYHRLVCAIEDAGFEIRDQLAWLFGSGFPKSHNQPGGWGTALKPAHEPIVLARKPLIGTVAANMQAHGTGALNIDASRVENGEARPAFEYFETGSKRGYDGGIKGGKVVGKKTEGRWPANVIHDGSEEVLQGFPPEAGAFGPVRGTEPSKPAKFSRVGGAFHGDSGSAARFFYTAKADAADRLDSKHPTVKPVDLIAYLVRLVTPPGGLVLDPFAGSGTTGMACMREGFRAVLIEREAEYVADIKRRIAHVKGEDAPLFAEAAP